MASNYSEKLKKAMLRIGSVSRVASFNSNLYTFTYRSRTATDPFPLVMLLQSKRTGNAFYTAKNGNRYMLAVNLNYVEDEGVRDLIVERLSQKGPIPWRHAQMIKRFFTRLGASEVGDYVRQYDIRKLRDLSVVDPTKYLGVDPF